MPESTALPGGGSALSMVPVPLLDHESQAWIDGLGAAGGDRDGWIARLHALLLKAARFEVHRRRAALPHLRGDDWDDLAAQSADDALLAVLGKLDDFRGESRFTTWAYKFALFEAAVNIRRRAWQRREVPLEPEGWPLVADGDATPETHTETTQLATALRAAIRDHLTPRQRDVLIAVVVNGVPIDVLAERRGTTRGALYKMLHDARRKLRAALAGIAS